MSQRKLARRVYAAVDALNAAIREAGREGVEVNLSMERQQLVAVCMVPISRNDRPTEGRADRAEIRALIVDVIARLAGGEGAIATVAQECGANDFQVREWLTGAQSPWPEACERLRELAAG